MKKAKDQQAGYVASADFGSAAVCAQCQMFVLPLGHREGDSPVAHEPPNIPHICDAASLKRQVFHRPP